MVKYRREIDPVQRKNVKRLFKCINLSVGIQMDTYEPIDRLVRKNISSENMTFMFPKISRACSYLYVLLRFPDKVEK